MLAFQLKYNTEYSIMQRISGTVLRDIRNMRKHNTYTSPGANDNQKSPQHRAQITKFIINDDLREKQLKIKTFDEKLEAHKKQIDKNNQMIAQLGNSLQVIKEQLAQQTMLTENEEKKNKQLREQMERTNRLLRSKNMKIQQITKKLDIAEKESSEFKASAGKAQQLSKSLGAAKRQSMNLEKTLEQLNNEKKSTLKEKQTEINQLKEYMNVLKAKLSQEQQLKRIVQVKDSELYILRNENSNILSRLQRQSHEKQQLKTNNESMKRQLEMALQNQKTSNNQQRRYQEDKKQFENMKQKLRIATAKLEELKGLESKLRFREIEAAELKVKNSERGDLIEHNKLTYQKALRQKEAIAESLQSQLTSQLKETETLKQSIIPLTKASNQLEGIRNRSDQLSILYKNLLPPLQCNFCQHNLSNPITVIPCGHNYCLTCKKGYTKACWICNDKVKIEAVYRNELLDDIAQVVRSIKQLIMMVK